MSLHLAYQAEYCLMIASSIPDGCSEDVWCGATSSIFTKRRLLMHKATVCLLAVGVHLNSMNALIGSRVGIR